MGSARIRAIIAACAAAAAPACVSASERIADSLEEAGLDAVRAQCVGQRLEDDLSIGQLRQLGAAARAYRKGDTSPGRFTLTDLIRVAGKIRDPEIPVAVARAAARCA